MASNEVLAECKHKRPADCSAGRCREESGGDLLSHGQSAVSLAQRCFTVLFGMGRRGTTSLWPPDISVGLQGVGLQPMSGC